MKVEQLWNLDSDIYVVCLNLPNKKSQGCHHLIIILEVTRLCARISNRWMQTTSVLQATPM